MKRALTIALILFPRLLLSEEEATPLYFPGGSSDIPGSANDRAAQAVRKWTDPAVWKETDPTKAPFYWDFSRVGRPVFLRVLKRSNRDGTLEVWLENPESGKFELFKVYRVAYFSGKLGPKIKQGDGQAPEGFYYVSRGRMNPNSRYHLSMDMGYPNAFDEFHGRTGDYLMIHGNSVSIGCFAMTDASIEQIYTLVDAALKKGQKFIRVHSFPFEMTEENLSRHADSEHIEFWENLKQGWDWFEREKRPPDVTVERGRYVFSDD
ncbi:MAG: murein L,D-transpeptidase [Verrucomicrobiales bacterium]|nr:murein L,D-transpeptidase [Verrucomicrobiales bacterium]